MSRLDIPGAKQVVQPAITEKGFWVPAITNLPFSVHSTSERDDDTVVVNVLAGGDGRVFDSSAWVQIEFKKSSSTIQEHFIANIRWGGLPKHRLEHIMSKLDIHGGTLILVKVETTSDSTWSISQQPARPNFLSHPFGTPLSIPRVHIGKLRCEYALTVGRGQITLVTINGDPGTLHLFKRGLLASGALPEDIYKEFSFLVDLPYSPYVLGPTAAVVDGCGFRGFLLPYHPAGSLNIVFSDCVRVVLPGPEGPAMVLAEGRTERIMWDLKVQMAWDIVKGLCWLHEQAIFWGDLTLNNIVLCLDGCCRFIDYCPSMCCTTSAPPESLPSAFTGPQDIFSLGLVLWCVAHEVGSFTRNQWETPILIWAQSIPTWYKEVVNQCLRLHPESRPTAEEVFDVFNMHLR